MKSRRYCEGGCCLNKATHISMLHYAYGTSYTVAVCSKACKKDLQKIHPELEGNVWTALAGTPVKVEVKAGLDMTVTDVWGGA